MFSLPGGPIGIAAGVEWRKESSSQSFGDLDKGILPVAGTTSDGQSFAAGSWVGDVSNAKSLGPVPSTRLLSSTAEYDFTDYFIELGLPLLADVPFFFDLSADLAFRSSDNSIFGEQSTVKYGLSWSPISDVRFRYTYSDATRVPNLFELFSPEQGSRYRPDDPCDKNNLATAADVALRTANCVADLQANGVASASIYDGQGNYVFEDPLSAGFPGATGGNQDLKPETGETTSYGIVLAPRFVEGLVLSVDYLKIDIADAILSVSPQNIVDKCYDSPTLANQFCSLIGRNDDPMSAQSGGLDFLRQVLLNFGAAIYEGYDATARYDFMAFDTALTASVTWSTVEKLLEVPQEGPQDDELGEMRRPKESAQFSLSGIRGAFGLEYSGMYLGKQTLNYEAGTEIETVMTNFGPSAFTDEIVVHNLRGSYTVEDFTLYGGINNLTDESPYASELAYPVSPVGRYFYVGATLSL
jgi:outer membrane receptor protein involved in Fe transport